MKLLATLLPIILLLIGCSTEPQSKPKKVLIPQHLAQKPQLIKKSFEDLPNFDDAILVSLRSFLLKTAKQKSKKNLWKTLSRCFEK